MTGPGRLPAGVRARIVGLAADALATMPASEIPAALRQVARFAPKKRATAGALPIAAALEDERFRASVSAVVRADEWGSAGRLAAGGSLAAADPVEVAALLWVLRPEGWEASLETAIAEAHAHAESVAARSAGEDAARLEIELNEERARRRTETTELRTQLTAAKAELDSSAKELRRAEDRAQRAEAGARSAAVAAGEARDGAAQRIAEAESELRRLRLRVSEAESTAVSGRAAARRDRDTDSMRLRLLLDSIIGAAQGLRRELALPPTESKPADLVASGRAADELATPSSQGRAPDDPAYLDRLLSVPTTHLIVDGYNVTMTAWAAQSLEQQRDRLIAGMAGLAARTGIEVTVVFDGAKQPTAVVGAVPRGLRVRFSDAGETADALIARFVAAEPQGRPLVVVSTDREVADRARAAGARPVPSVALVRLLGRA